MHFLSFQEAPAKSWHFSKYKKVHTKHTQKTLLNSNLKNDLYIHNQNDSLK